MNHRAAFGGVWRVELPMAAAIFGLVALALLVALVRSRLRRGGPSSKTSYPRTEVTYVCLVAVAAAFLVGLSITANRPTDPRPAVRVHVSAFQWCWRFDYVGTGVSVAGTCIGDHVPTLEVPSGRPVAVSLTSADVVHSFWVPYQRFKMQAIPGIVNRFDMEFPHPGTYAGRCAEYCGIYHYAMHFRVRAVPPARFTAWLHGREHHP